MKKLILPFLALNLTAAVALADINPGVYKGKTTEGKNCQLTVEMHPYNAKRNVMTVMFSDSEDKIQRDSLNTAPGKLSALYSDNMKTLNLKYDELGPSLRIQADITAKSSAAGLAELNWLTQRIVWGQGKELQVTCVDLKKQ